jgi:hypothetical protein
MANYKIDDLESVRIIYENNGSIKLVAKKFNVGYRAARSAILRAGCTLNLTNSEKAAKIDESLCNLIYDYYVNKKYTYRQIKEKTGLHNTLVKKILLNMGLTEDSLQRRKNPSGRASGNWKTGRYIDENNYVRIRLERDHKFNSMINSSGCVFEHRLVMAEHLGRPLLPHENVHHIDGNRQNNRIENLELWSKMQPAGQRVEDKVDFAIEVLSIYRPEMLCQNGSAPDGGMVA